MYVPPSWLTRPLKKSNNKHRLLRKKTFTNLKMDFRIIKKLFSSFCLFFCTLKLLLFVVASAKRSFAAPVQRIVDRYDPRRRL